jgi:ABC-type metal ion transport system substrate-binding protein
MKKLLLIIVLLLFCISFKTDTQKKEVKIKNDVHMTITMVNHSMTQEAVMNTNNNCVNLDKNINLNIVEHHFFLNNYIDPVAGMIVEVTKVFNPIEVVNRVYNQIGDLQSDRYIHSLNIYLLHSTCKLGRT